MSNHIITIKGLEKTYTDSLQSLTILHDVDMVIEQGKKVILLGESGCGKSTLLNIIAGLDAATKGTVQVGDITVSNLIEKELAEYRSKFLGLIFQFHYLLKDFTALENVYLPLYMTGENKKTAIEKAKILLCDVGLENRMNHLPSQMSGGEKQRAAVARSLIHNPELILADEPTGNLDPENALLISDILFSLVEKYNKTLLLVTHEMALCDRGDITYRIKQGRVEYDI